MVVGLPKDIQFAPIDMGQVEPAKSKAVVRYRPVMIPDADAISQAADIIVSASRPIIYGGGGIINSGDEAS